MDVVVSAAHSPWSYIVPLLVFGFCPPMVIRLLVRVYPPGHPRRRELPAELHVVPYKERPLWIAEQLGLVLTEGVRARIAWAPYLLTYVRWWFHAGRGGVALGSFGVAALFAEHDGWGTALMFAGLGCIFGLLFLAGVIMDVRGEAAEQAHLVAAVLPALMFEPVEAVTWSVDEAVRIADGQAP